MRSVELQALTVSFGTHRLRSDINEKANPERLAFSILVAPESRARLQWKHTPSVCGAWRLAPFRVHELALKLSWIFLNIAGQLGEARTNFRAVSRSFSMYWLMFKLLLICIRHMPCSVPSRQHFGFPLELKGNKNRD